jgi:hypothetical protein
LLDGCLKTNKNIFLRLTKKEEERERERERESFLDYVHAFGNDSRKNVCMRDFIFLDFFLLSFFFDYLFPKVLS